jgi:hypothetical protein
MIMSVERFPPPSNVFFEKQHSTIATTTSRF